MNDFLSEIQCDEMPFEPKQSDWLEFQMWLDSLPVEGDEMGVELERLTARYGLQSSDDFPF
jgi:hypothetical protein